MYSKCNGCMCRQTTSNINTLNNGINFWRLCLTFSHIWQIWRGWLWKHSGMIWSISVIVSKIIELSWKHSGKWRNYTLWAIFSFAIVFKKIQLQMFERVSRHSVFTLNNSRLYIIAVILGLFLNYIPTLKSINRL